jgi:ATP/maltotriose-dependent transcriptional regulator MalT
MAGRSSLKIPKPVTQSLESGRESFRKQAWAAAFSQLSAADRESPLSPECLVELAQAALLLGKEAEGADVLARAQQEFMNLGLNQPAARCAFWLGFTSMLNGEMARASGWLSRAGRLLDGCPDCAEKGYLLLPVALRSFQSGDPVSAYASFVEAVAIGDRFRDKDLTALALQGQGRALIRQGKISNGLALLDEAMVAVTAGEVSALTAGGVYCSVLDACGEIFDLQRAQEWTSALERWCASQPDLVPYRGHCLIRRAELLQLHGSWPNALAEAQRASEWLSHPVPKPAVGGAFYQIAEVQRLRGKFAEAEEAYGQATQWRSVPGPGFAQLRLAQGRIEEANTEIRRLADEVHEIGPRVKVLDAYVEIVLADRDVAAARTASDRLMEIAAQQQIPYLEAVALRASGAVLLAEGRAREALGNLKQSWTIWCELHAPYEASRVRLLMALANRELGNENNAILELTAARQGFEDLGAAVDVARAEELLARGAVRNSGSLTGREIQVLKLVASGITNRQIAGKLKISEKTVARHMSNIFMKLGVYSRTAATTYAYNHNLL